MSDYFRKMKDLLSLNQRFNLSKNHLAEMFCFFDFVLIHRAINYRLGIELFKNKLRNKFAVNIIAEILKEIPQILS